MRRGFPDLDIGSAYELALAAAAGGAPRDRAETYLAFTPWMDDGVALVRAFGRGLVGFDVILWAGLEREAAVERRRAVEAGETGPEDPVARLHAAMQRKGAQA